MAKKLHHFSTILLPIWCVPLVLLAGCWSSSSDEAAPEMEAKELTTKKDEQNAGMPEAELVRLSKKLYQVRMYSLARDSLNSLKDRYPLGAYATFGEIKAADSYFFNGQFNEAAKSYESFLKNFPGHTDTPYVKLQAARSFVASARGGGRDRQPLERGLTIYDELAGEYPNTPYAALARSERQPIIEQLAEYDAEIIEFYRKTGNEAAVRDREQKYQERWASRLIKQPAPPPLQP